MVQNVLRRTRQVPSAMVSLASPYLLSSQAELAFAHSYQPVAQDAVADGLLGMLRMDGRLPVSLPGYYQLGIVLVLV